MYICYHVSIAITMIRKIPLTLLYLICSISLTFGQEKLIVGQRHSVTLQVPGNWAEAYHEQLPFFIRPAKNDTSVNTYLYVFGLDYEKSPNLDSWIAGNNQEVREQFDNMQIGALDLQLDNLKEDGFLTGKYKVLTYDYPDKRKEVLLIIECKFSIITVVISADNSHICDAYLDDFTALAKSLKIMNAELMDAEALN
jgi:hypothetical protein